MRETWRALHAEARQACCHNSFLDRFGRGFFTDEEARQFGIQRYLKAQSFIHLVLALWDKVLDTEQYREVSLAVGRNVSDEMALSRPKVVTIDPWQRYIRQPHEEHRRAFYEAWGIEQEHLTACRTDPSAWYPTTRAASEVLTVEWARENASVLELAGWLAMAEHVLPGELQQILRGLEIRYPDRFSDPSQPDIQALYAPHQLEAMRYARWYAVDHIRHDSGEHSQELEAALAPFMTDATCYQQIERGARRAIEVNVKFYAGFC
jgi:hypothetical protein